MNPRTAPAALTLLTAALAATACGPSNSSSGTAANPTTTHSATAQPTANPSCIADFGPDGSGIHAFGGTVTGTVTLDCTGAPQNVSVELFYRPDTRTGTSDGGGPTNTAGAPAYSSTGPCKPGLWYVGTAFDPGTGHLETRHGNTVTLTADDCH